MHIEGKRTSETEESHTHAQIHINAHVHRHIYTLQSHKHMHAGCFANYSPCWPSFWFFSFYLFILYELYMQFMKVSNCIPLAEGTNNSTQGSQMWTPTKFTERNGRLLSKQNRKTKEQNGFDPKLDIQLLKNKWDAVRLVVHIDRSLGSEMYYLFDLSILFAQGGELILLRLWIHFCYCCNPSKSDIFFFLGNKLLKQESSLEIRGYFTPARRRASAPPKRNDLEDPAKLRIDPWPFENGKDKCRCRAAGASDDAPKE